MSYYFALLLALLKSHTIKMDFKPNGQIVMLQYENAMIYTDTTALFSVYKENGNIPAYDLRVVQLIRKTVREAKKDTVLFSGKFVPFDDIIKDQNQTAWDVGWVVTHLVNDNKMMILDKNNMWVEKVKVKAVGHKQKHWASVKMVYINKDTKEELFSEGKYLRRSELKWL